MPSDAGQFGIALTHTVDDWATKFGFYATRFHSRTGYSGVIKSLTHGRGRRSCRETPPARIRTYYTEFPEGIRMFGVSFETKFKVATTFGELTYRPNQPLQFNASDLVGAVVSPLAPTTLRDQELALPPGGTLSGFERHKHVQFQLGRHRAGPQGARRSGPQLGRRGRSTRVCRTFPIPR